MLAQLQISAIFSKGAGFTYWMTWALIVPCLFEVGDAKADLVLRPPVKHLSLQSLVTILCNSRPRIARIPRISKSSLWQFWLLSMGSFTFLQVFPICLVLQPLSWPCPDVLPVRDTNQQGGVVFSEFTAQRRARLMSTWKSEVDVHATSFAKTSARMYCFPPSTYNYCALWHTPLAEWLLMIFHRNCAKLKILLNSEAGQAHQDARMERVRIYTRKCFSVPRPLLSDLSRSNEAGMQQMFHKKHPRTARWNST